MHTEFDAHPFAGFLHRLPVDVPTITNLPGDVEGSRQYLDYLSELASALKESEINVDTNSRPRSRPVGEARTRLSSVLRRLEKEETTSKPGTTGAMGKKDHLLDG